MALNATIFKAVLQIADMDRGYYHDHTLTLASHPSETDERMMVRLLAFVRHAQEALVFGKGLSSDDEPDLWQKDLTGVIDLWIDVGLPDEKRIRRACGRSAEVVVYGYGGRAVDIWWDQTADKVARSANLTVINLPSSATQPLAKLAQRTMQLQCSVQDGHIWITGPESTVEVELRTLKAPAR